MPALVGIRTKRAHPERLQNYTIRNVEVKILDKNDNILEKDFGDIYLDEYGLAGPTILRLNRKIAERLYKGEKLFVSVDMKPKLSKEQLRKEIVKVLQERMGQSVESVVRAWLPKELVEDYKHWLKRRKEEYKSLNQRVGNADFILEYLKSNKDEIIGDMGWHEAIVTKGGVDLTEVDCNSMQSKRVKGLFFSGEVLDFDGDTGGFNLQIAFSTAFLAAKSMCK
jgi:predicted Rossmann fold flavoprotein